MSWFTIDLNQKTCLAYQHINVNFLDFLLKIVPHALFYSISLKCFTRAFYPVPFFGWIIV